MTSRVRPRRGVGLLAAAVVAVIGLTACTSGGGGAGKHHVGGTGHTIAPPTPTPVATTGESPLGAHWDWSRESSFEPYLKTVPGSATFDEIVWCDIEPKPGQFDWQAVDKVAMGTHALGITLMLKIRTGVCANTVSNAAQHVRGSAGKTESSMPASMSAYQAFVTAVVKRYSPYGVHEYAIENEVNSPSYWSGTPQQYVSLVTAAASAIRAADPKAEVVDAGMSSTSYGYGIADRLLQQGQSAQAVSAYTTYFSRRIGTRGEQIPNVSSVQQLQSVLSSAQGKRNLAYLAVAAQLAKSKITDVRQVHFYEEWNAIPELLDYLHAETPAATPIEAWEVGSFWKGGNASDQERAAEMVKSEALLLAGGVSKALWLPLAANADNRRGSEVRYGLLDPDGTVRPAGVTMTAMVAASRDASFSAVGSGGLQGVAFRADGTTTLVVWATGAAVTLKPSGGQAKMAQLGAMPATAPARVSIGANPVLVQSGATVSALLSSTT